MSVIKKVITLFGAVLLVFLTGTVHAVPFVFTAHGTISSGWDSTGIFGTVGTSLTGLKYRQSISFDPEQNVNNYDGGLYQWSGGPGATALVTTEVSGHTFASEVEPAGTWPYASVQNFLTVFGPDDVTFDWSDSVFAATCTELTDPQFTCVWQTVRSYSTPFVPSASLNQSFSYAVQAGDEFAANFYTNGLYGSAFFEATVESLTWRTVPEPTTIALLGIGVLVGGLRRKPR